MHCFCKKSASNCCISAKIFIKMMYFCYNLYQYAAILQKLIIMLYFCKNMHQTAVFLQKSALNSVFLQKSTSKVNAIFLYRSASKCSIAAKIPIAMLYFCKTLHQNAVFLQKSASNAVFMK